MKETSKSTRQFCLFGGASGLLGVILIVTSFTINAGPPPGATYEQMKQFAILNQHSILWGAWLQAVGPVFIVLFAFSLVYIAGYTGRLAGWMTFFGATILMTVSLLEITFYISTLFKDPPLNGLFVMNLISAVQHLYFIIAAPALFIPLGIILIRSGVLPRIFGWFAIGLGLLFFTLGMTTMLILVIPPQITFFGILQGFWWLSASLAFLIIAGKAGSPQVQS
ncbi:MAG TPA: hypothetical protein VGG71_15605 [Chitinophagaceae bacterium]